MRVKIVDGTHWANGLTGEARGQRGKDGLEVTLYVPGSGGRRRVVGRLRMEAWQVEPVKKIDRRADAE
jgi:hypothetical protein